MSFDGAGQYSLVAGLQANLANGQPNDGTEVYAAFADIATALSTAVCKDGQTTITANMPMSGFKFTGLGAGATTGDSIRYEQVFTTGTVALLGNLSIGTSNNGSAGVTLSQDDTLSWNESATESLPSAFRIGGSAALALGYGVKYSSNSGQMASSYGSSIGHSAVTVGSAQITFYANASDTVSVGTDVTMAERMRLTSGHLLIARDNATNFGSFSNTDAGIAYAYEGAMHIARDSAFSKVLIQDITNQAGTYISFGSGSTTTGSISTDGSVTAYNTTSDRRLKDNIKVMTVPPEIDDVEIIEFDWRDGTGKGRGVSAQDLHAIFPEAVTPGDPDFDTDPENKRPWMVDYSKLVPHLFAAVQDLRKRVTALEGGR